MKVFIVYSAIVLGVWLLGMVFDILGLYIGVKCATKGKIKTSKAGYFIMTCGEICIGISTEAMMFIPVLLLAVITKII